MSKKLTIKKLFKDTITTSRGESDKYTLYFKEKPNFRASCFVGQWNADWKEGMVIEVEDEQWIKNEGKDGKIYWNIKAPASARGFQIPEWIKVAIKDLQDRVAQLETQFETQEPTAEEEIPVFEEEPQEENKVNTKDIPF